MPSAGLSRTFAFATVGFGLAGLAVGAASAWHEARARSEERARTRVVRAAEAAARAVATGAAADAFAREARVTAARAAGDPEAVVLLRTRAEIDAAFADPRIPLWRSALDGQPAARVFDGEPGAVATRPLAGEPPPGLVEARLSASEVAAPLGRLAARAAFAALLVGGVAAFVGRRLSRRYTGQLARLVEAASRWSRGDLGASLGPAPPESGDELGALTDALERARGSLAAGGRRLERRSGELEAVLGGVAEGVFSVDRDRRIQYLSPRAAALLGVDAAAASGRFCGDVLRPEPVDGERLCDVACPILQARYRGPARALERLVADEPSRPALVVSLSSSAPDDGVQVQILREQTPEEAARRARDAVVADLAHELKTPLAAQRASLELLGERLAERDAEGATLAATAQSGTLRLERLIDNLLESVRIESGETSLRRAPVDLDEAVEEAASTTAPLVAKRGQRLELQLPYPLARPTGDAPRLVQVLVNLLANASKFAPEGSEIRVGGTVDAEEVRLWVEDQGPGFDEAVWTRPPARFRRGPGEPREPGTGLGLWIARSIVERHGGALEIARVESRTRVGFRLPLGGPT